MKEIYDAIDRRKAEFLETFKDFLRRPSVSSTGEGIAECAEHLRAWLAGWGVSARIVPTGGHPVVLGRLAPPSPVRRVIVYGHYDVKQPGDLSEWETPPFDPVEKDGCIYARGTADNKGQILANAIAVRLLHEAERLRAAVTFVIEGEEEVGSTNFAAFADAHRGELEADIQYASDGPRHLSGRPTVCLGNRGNLCMRLSVRNEIGAHVHSGNLGELVRNPAWDLVHLLQTMKTPEGDVLIPGFYDDAAPSNDLEKEAMANIPDTDEEIRQRLGLERLYGPEHLSAGEKLMFRPTLTIEGFDCGMESTIIPGRATAYLDARLVKNMTPEGTFEKIKKHVEAQGVPGVEIRMTRGGLPSKTPLDHPLVRSVFDAFGKMHEEGQLDAPPVVLPLAGGSNASTHTFTETLGMPAILARYAQPNNGQHGPNERLRIDHFMTGIKMGAAALAALGR